METTPTVENAATWFNAKTVTHHLDVVDRQTASIVDTRTAEGSTVRFFNAAEEEFMTLKSDNVSKRFQPLLCEKLMGVRHAEDGRLYAILSDPDPDKEELGATYEEPVDVFPFADVQVGPDCKFERRISAVALEYGPAAVTVSLMASFDELVTATRPYSEGEADYLL